MSNSKVRLSQCMIVKNEEKNIETALGWAKSHAFEQIIVDTGSTDRTVEIAKNIGAKIFHFKWINDFAAAKNYAIKQATGDWIAFLDADEYLSEDDARKLMELLDKLDSDSNNQKKYLGIVTPWVNVDDNGKPMTIAKQSRVFRNKPDIRYQGSIHESLSIDGSKYYYADDIDIIHTGYSQSSHMETGKSERNKELLREELKKNPDDISLKAYLANSLSTETNEESQKEAELLFTEVLESKEKIFTIHKIKAYIFFINKLLGQQDLIRECEDICRKALSEFPQSLDFEYFLAVTLSRKGDCDEAWDHFKNCERNLIKNSNHDDSIMIPADPTVLFGQMIITAKKRDDIENIVLYSTHLLTIDKTRISVLAPCIATLLTYGVTEAETIELLSNIYDLKNQDDVKFVAAAAAQCGATAFADNILMFLEDR